MNISHIKWNELLLKTVSESELILEAEAQPWSGIDELGLDFSEVEKKGLLKSHIKVVRIGGENHVFVDNFYIKTLNSSLSVRELKKEILDASEEYSLIKIGDYSNLRVDTEIENDTGFVLDESMALGITLPKKYIHEIKKLDKAGIAIQVELYNTEKDFILGFYDGERKVGELNFKESQYMYTCENLSQTVKSVISNTSTNPNKREGKIFGYLKIEEKEYPKSLDIEKRTLEIIRLLNSVGGYFPMHSVLILLSSLPENLKVPMTYIPHIVQRYFNNEIDYYRQSKYMVEDPYSIIPLEVGKIPGIFELSEGNFSMVHQLQSVMDSVLFKAIQFAPREACENIDSIMGRYLSLYIELPGNNGLGKYGNRTKLRYSILSSIFDNQPSLRNDFPELFSEFKSFESKATERESYDAVFSGDMDTNVSEFTNAIQFPATFDVLRYIKDNIFDEGEDLTEKERESYKLAIARNISMRFNMDSFRIKKAMIDDGQQLIEEEWENIQNLQKSFSPEYIFEGKNTFHIIHWGQGKDAYGTPKTVEGFESKKGNGNYTALDGEDMNNKSLGERNEMLGKMWSEFITSSKPATLILEGHANNGLFSVFLGTKDQDSTGSFYTDQERIDVTPKNLAHIIKLRNNWKRQNEIDTFENDIVIFSACRGDYIVNTYNEMLINNGGEFTENFTPPIIISAAEFGQNSIYNPNDEIPQQFFREVLMLKDPSVNPTMQTLFDNQGTKENLSNPTIFVPQLQDGKWIPKNIG